MRPTTQASLPLTIFLVGLFLVLCLAWVVELLVVVPAFEIRFEDFRLRLPFLTEMIIGTARFAVRFWFLLIPCLLPVFALAGLISYVLRHRVGNRLWSTAWFILLIGLPIAAHALLWIALLHPWHQLQMGLKK